MSESEGRVLFKVDLARIVEKNKVVTRVTIKCMEKSAVGKTRIPMANPNIVECPTAAPINEYRLVTMIGDNIPEAIANATVPMRAFHRNSYCKKSCKERK
jgi:hypothetical protein